MSEQTLVIHEVDTRNLKTPLSPKNQFAVLFIVVISYEWYSPIGFYFRVVKALPRNANW